MALGRKTLAVDNTNAHGIAVPRDPALQTGVYGYDVEKTEEQKGRKMSRVAGPALTDSDEDSVMSVGKQLELESTNSIKYRTCSWQKTAALLFAEYICLAIMSFPYSYSILGLVPGLIVTVVVAASVLYTSLIVWEFCVRHPEVRDVCDLGQMLFYGWRWVWYATAAMFLLNNTMIQGLHVLTGAKYLNTMTNGSMCTVGFSAIMAVICFVCSLPRTFDTLSKLATLSAFFTFISVLLAAIFAGIEQHPYNYNAGVGVTKGPKVGMVGEPTVLVVATAGTTFVSGMSAFLNISYTFIGQITIPSFIAEMKNPNDFPKALWAVTIAEIILFSLVGSVVYAYTGTQYNTAPAFGSLGNELFKKVSFSFMIPTLIFLGVLYASVSARFVFFRLFEGTRHKGNHTAVGWASWAGILAATWIVAFVIAEVIPFFSDLLSLMSSLFDSFFGFIFWGVAYMRMRKADYGAGWISRRGIRGIAGFALNVAIILLGVFMLTAGTYASVQSILNDYATGSWVIILGLSRTPPGPLIWLSFNRTNMKGSKALGIAARQFQFPRFRDQSSRSLSNICVTRNASHANNLTIRPFTIHSHNRHCTFFQIAPKKPLPRRRDASSNATDSTTLKHTALYDLHLAHGGKMVPFGGYSMPVQYEDLGVGESHKWTREKASLFDVGHMVQHEISGPGASSFLEKITPTSTAALKPFHSTLSCLLHPGTGGIVDDTVITRIGPEKFYLVTNAACRDKDLAYLENFGAHQDKGIHWEVLEGHGLVALQGPLSADILQNALRGIVHEDEKVSDLKSLYFGECAQLRVNLPSNASEILISRGGYTGEDGFEISIKPNATEEFTNHLLQSAGPDKLRLAGLGARDSLRLEAGMCLYGHDLDDSTTPVEAGLSWIVHKDRRTSGGFHGDEVILRQLRPAKEGGGVSRRRVGLVVDGAPAREGADILGTTEGREENVIGKVTSGCPSPTLGKNIAMGYVENGHHKAGTEVGVLVRGKRRNATVTKMPFVQSRYWKQAAGTAPG